MTRVDFYLLSSDSERKLFDTVCLLIEKARQADQSVYVHTRSAEHANQLDEVLWRYRSSSFIPHLNLGAGSSEARGAADARYRQPDIINTGENKSGSVSATIGNNSGSRGNGVGEPVIVGLPAGNDTETRVAIGYCHEPVGRRDVLINMSDTVPVFFSRFRRTLEVVGASESARNDSRERYRFYKSRGYPLNHHNLS